MKKSVLAVAMGALMVVGAAHADGHGKNVETSVGFGYQTISVGDISNGALNVNYRKMNGSFNDFGVEFGITRAINSDKISGIEVKANMLNASIVYLNEVAPNVQVGGKLGFAYTNVSATGSSETASGLDYALMGEYGINEKWGVTAVVGATSGDLAGDSATYAGIGANYKF